MSYLLGGAGGVASSAGTTALSAAQTAGSGLLNAAQAAGQGLLSAAQQGGGALANFGRSIFQGGPEGARLAQLGQSVPGGVQMLGPSSTFQSGIGQFAGGAGDFARGVIQAYLGLDPGAGGGGGLASPGGAGYALGSVPGLSQNPLSAVRALLASSMGSATRGAEPGQRVTPPRGLISIGGKG